MFTLLSEQHKKFILKQYRLRLISVVMFFASALFISAAVMLLPSFATLYIETARLEDESESTLKKISNKSSEGLVTTLNEIKSMVSLANLDETKIYTSFGSILSKKPVDVTITLFDYTHNLDGTGIIKFQGISQSRSSLLAFSKILKTQNIFTTVDLPISNLAKETDVKYLFTLTGKF